ncbi:MAG: lysozyme inhibitor LprI family protein [Pseudomonadota bacterium]
MRYFLAALFVATFLAIMPRFVAAQDIDCNNATSTVEMKFCAGEELDRADAALNATWKRAMGHARTADADWLPDGAPSRVELLRDAQRKWIPYRDAACEAQATKYYGGTGQTLELVVCLTAMTKQRTRELQTFMADG